MKIGRYLALALLCCGKPAVAEEVSDGKALLAANCGRCHAVDPSAKSPRPQAPNLAIVLQSYPAERLQSELAEGISPKHPDMPQVRFSPSEIASIYYYLHGKSPDSENRRPQ
jgi:cytochrome c